MAADENPQVNQTSVQIEEHAYMALQSMGSPEGRSSFQGRALASMMIETYGVNRGGKGMHSPACL